MSNPNPSPENQFKPGQSGNPGGRPVNSMKSYVAKKLAEMSDEEKDEWLKEHKISGDLQWRQAEGNPHQSTDTEHSGSVEVTGVNISVRK